MMSSRRSEQTDNLLLTAATMIPILTARRYFQANPLRKSDRQLANSAVA
jgi:hypothetical protein